MGMDIYSGRGVIFTVDEFLKVINGKSKSEVVAVCLTFHQDLVVDARQHPDDDWRQNLAESFKPLSELKKSMPLNTIRGVIDSCVGVRGEVSKYGECWVENSEYAQDLFTKILDACPHANDLPYIMEVTAWGSGRNNGWEVPKGVACVVFDSESCYERTLSDQGKAVKKLLGHCNETEWTEMSC